MHDDIVTPAERSSWVLEYVLRPALRWVLLRAGQIYAISPEMQQLLNSKYGVDSELQWPSTERERGSESVITKVSAHPHSAVIIFAGSILDTAQDSLKLVAEILVTGKLRVYSIQSAELHLYAHLSPERIRECGWDHPSISVHSWVSKEQLQGVLRTPDIPFLPFSFSEKARYAMECACPSKTADYFAAGQCILVFGPLYSSLVRYAAEQGFAEIVDEFSPDALARGIPNIVAFPAHEDPTSFPSIGSIFTASSIDGQRSQFRSMLNSLTGETHI